MNINTDIVKDYPEDGWLRGYFVADSNDSSHAVDKGKGWKKNLDFLRLRDAALIRLDIKKGEKILDLGCADGCTMTYCGLQGAIVKGVDLDPNGVEAANNLIKKFDVDGEAVCADASKTGFPDNSFDKVISSDFFEHVTHEAKIAILSEVWRVLRPGGKLVIKTPNLNYLTLSLRFKQLKAILTLKNPFKLVIPHTPGTDDPQHIGIPNRKILDNVLEMSMFQNRTFFYAPLRRFGLSSFVTTLSTEIPYVRDWLCEDVFCEAYKPIVLAHFPD